jgi:hypothetical protein
VATEYSAQVVKQATRNPGLNHILKISSVKKVALTFTVTNNL